MLANKNTIENVGKPIPAEHHDDVLFCEIRTKLYIYWAFKVHWIHFIHVNGIVVCTIHTCNFDGNCSNATTYEKHPPKSVNIVYFNFVFVFAYICICFCFCFFCCIIHCIVGICILYVYCKLYTHRDTDTDTDTVLSDRIELNWIELHEVNRFYCLPLSQSTCESSFFLTRIAAVATIIINIRDW